MPPKSRGRPRGRGGGGRGRGRARKAVSEANSEESVRNEDTSDNSSVFSGQKAKSSRNAPAMEPRFPRPTGPEAGTPIARASRHQPPRAEIPEILREMVDEAADPTPERPLKKRKIRGRATSTEASEKPAGSEPRDRGSSAHFEDVTSPKSKQTFFRESDDESDDNDITWEDVDVDVDFEEASLGASPQRGPSTSKTTSNLQDLDLNLTINTKVSRVSRSIARRKPISKEEAKLRISIHKMHILCLLAHVNIRNNWCNDAQVHNILRPLLTPKIMKYFKPPGGSAEEKMSRNDSLKAGLTFLNYEWRTKFKITEKGCRRSLWADREEALQHLAPPQDVDSVHDIDDFRTAATVLQGSRDVGAQLYCALLRCAGLDVRLVCSLQPLSCKRTPDEPSMLVTAVSKETAESSETDEEPPIDTAKLSSPIGGGIASSSNGAMSLTATRRRLGNTIAANQPNKMISATNYPSHHKRKTIQESPYPIHWVEVLCEGLTTRWIPVHPLVDKHIDKRLSFEPPASDRENSMVYVIAFEDDGRAREVTRRYTKAFNAKTRKLRVESTEGGKEWWRETMERFSRGFVSGVDDVEDLEMAKYDTQEPMPKSIADFKDHPRYALERHLRRNEVIVTGREIGKIATGVKVEGTGGAFPTKTKKLESVYRRTDVKVTKSADGWYRVGREVKMGEQPVKTVPARNRANDDMEFEDGGVQDRAGVGLYTEDQTQLYDPPPVVNGRVPTNSYGNLDIYVPSMVPKGGVHIPDPEAKLAARLIGVHSADAVTGFEFRGRHGTAVIRGIVVATEFREAIKAVIQGIRDEQQNAEDERRTLVALRMWKKFMIGLRVKERVAGYEIEGERNYDLELEDPDAKDVGMESEDDEDEYVDDEAGGFFPE